MGLTNHTHPQNWGVLLVGHGTRNERGRAEFLETACDVAAQIPHALVEPCFLELGEPDIAAGIRRLAEQRVDRICVVPLMLLAAGHVKRDIPTAVREAAENSGAPPWIFAEHLGCHPGLLQLSAQRYDEALAEFGSTAPNHTQTQNDTLLLLVARGNRDPAAIAEMHRFGQLRRETAPARQVRTCFVALAEPAFDDVLANADRATFRRIVIQPHLLFVGRMLSTLRQRVEVVANSSPDTQFVVTGHFGPSPLLTRTIVDLIERAGCVKPPSDDRADS
jgi:sirohydrochlorin ferrochelatase